MKSIKNRVLVSFLALALVMTSVFTPSVSAEAASKKAVKSVTLKVGSKKVNKKTQKLTVGKSLTVKTTVSPSSAKKKVTYKSSNKKVATVSSKGKVKAKKAGTAKITVTVKGKNNKTKSAWFKVKVVKKATPTKKPTATPKPTKKPTATPTATPAPQEVEVEGINLEASATTIEAGQTAQIYATIIPANATNKTVTYTSSDPSVATVDANGVVKAIKNGQVTIIATTANGKTDKIDIKVERVVPTKMRLNATNLNMTVGDTKILTATFTPEDTTVTDVTWSSKDENIVKVDANGKVTAAAPGTTVVTAKSIADTNLVAQCTITVKEKSNEKTDGVTISVVNSLNGYDKTVFTGTNADVRVRVYDNGTPVGNTDVTLKMEYKSGTGNYWYISNNQSTTSTVKTDDQGMANFTISLKNGLEYDATDGVMGGYLLTATATGASTTAQEPLTFARFTIGSANGRVATDDYSFSNITVNDALTTLVPGNNAAQKGYVGERQTQTIERRIIDAKDNASGTSELIGTSEYVISQKRSTDGTDDHAVTFNAAPLIEFPEVITGTTDNDYVNEVNFECKGYSIYDTTQSTVIEEVPTNLNYAGIKFTNVCISKNTALKIEVYDSYDKVTGTYGAVLAKYAIKGEHVQNKFTFPIPMQELALKADDFVYIKVFVQSEGQVDVDKAIGFKLVNFIGNYIGTSKYKNISKVYEDASIEWQQVTKSDSGQDFFKYASYSNEITMTADMAESYGIETKNSGDTYYNATVKYQLPIYPHIGNAYVTVTKPNSSEKPTYFMIPTYVVDNKNELLPASETVQAFRITEEEATQYGEERTTITSNETTVTINSELSGVTEIYGLLTVPGLDCLTLEERRLFAYVEWASLPKEEQKNITDFYALVGQTITVDVELSDGSNTEANREVEFYLGDDKGEKLTRADLPEGVEITNDSTKFDETKSTIVTDKDGKAHITFKSTDYTKGIFDEPLFAKCEGYKVTMSVAGETAEYAKLHWIAPGLAFTDQTQVDADEVADKIEQKAVTTVTYKSSTTDVKQTEEQKKDIDTNWLIGYKVIGLVKDGTEKAESKENAEINGYSNVIITGAETDITLNGSGTNDVLGKVTNVDKKNATIQVTSEKTGLDLIKGSISRDSIDESAIMNFTLLDEAGNVIKTVPNVGQGETSAYVGLNIPVRWKPVNMSYEIVTPSGYEFAVDADLLAKKTETIYVKVFDSKNNMLDGYEVNYTVIDNGTGEEIVPEKTAISENGLVAITYDIPNKTCTYGITATIEGNASVNKSINYRVREESSVDFAMKTAALSSADKKITIKLSDRVNEATVVKEMFTSVVDNLGKEYTVSSVDANGDTLVLTLEEDINPSANYINVKYNYVKEDITKEQEPQMARRMVSNSQSAVSMVDGFTITAYSSKQPTLKYTNGVVEKESGTLHDGAYVIFTYGESENKLYNVEYVKVVGGKATCEAAKSAKCVVAYVGSVATNVFTNSAATETEVVEPAVETTEEVVETVVATEATAEETTVEETTTEVVEEAVAEVVAE